jgi:hypothetical protein
MRHWQILLATFVGLLTLTLAGCASSRSLCRTGFVPINPTTAEHQP